MKKKTRLNFFHTSNHTRKLQSTEKYPFYHRTAQPWPALHTIFPSSANENPCSSVSGTKPSWHIRLHKWVVPTKIPRSKSRVCVYVSVSPRRGIQTTLWLQNGRYEILIFCLGDYLISYSLLPPTVRPSSTLTGGGVAMHRRSIGTSRRNLDGQFSSAMRDVTCKSDRAAD